MKQDQTTSFSLLNQDEIDVLVKFLTETRNTAVDSDVLSQNSIDKLINLIQTDKGLLSLNSSYIFDLLDASMLQKLYFREDLSQLCELLCSIDEKTGYIDIDVSNKDTGKTIKLTPGMFEQRDTEDWGYSILPVYFNQIALSLSLKYSKETYNFVCRTFAKCNYGDENYALPEIYLPDPTTLAETMLE